MHSLVISILPENHRFKIKVSARRTRAEVADTSENKKIGFSITCDSFQGRTDGVVIANNMYLISRLHLKFIVGVQDSERKAEKVMALKISRHLLANSIARFNFSCNIFLQ